MTNEPDVGRIEPSADAVKLVDGAMKAAHEQGSSRDWSHVDECNSTRAALLDYIAGLQAENERYQTAYEVEKKYSALRCDEVARLTQALAAKDREIERLTREKDEWTDVADEIRVKKDAEIERLIIARSIGRTMVAAEERLQAAIEGECNGLAITQEQAMRILDYVAQPLLCADEGCPHHGTPHVCVSHTAPAPAQASPDAALREAAYREPNAMKAAALMAEANMGPFRAALKRKAAKRRARAALNQTGEA